VIELADTSAWTNRNKSPHVRADFDRRVMKRQIATCEMVEFELLCSAVDVLQFRAARRRLAALPRAPIHDGVWRRATDVFERLAADGPYHRRIPVPDLLVAAAAEIAEMPVCHYDRDFELIASVTGQPVRAIAPLGSL
jgi:predicted nucleic acid-binding protein